MTKLLLDSGDPLEYKDIKDVAQTHGSELWGSTTNPSLIAKKLAGKKLTPQDAFKLQKDLVMEILGIVKGAVSAEVYADKTTSAHDMIVQGMDIASWHDRVVVKLPTTLEGMKARTALRKKGITINNTLVFSQQQVFAITLNEKLLMQENGPTTSGYPCFISPFVGRLDDIGQNGMSMVRNSMNMLAQYYPDNDLVWMLIASVRSLEHYKASLESKTDLITAPAKIYAQWFGLSPEEQKAVDYGAYEKTLTPVTPWSPHENILNITSTDQLMDAMTSGKLDITHELTTAGIDKFVQDWKAILQ